MGRAIRGLGLVVVASIVAGCMPEGGFLITPVSTDRRLQETTLMSESPFASARIAVIDVEGVLLNSNTPRLLGEGEHPVSFLLEQLDMARRDSRVKGVLLRINSPGGSVTASELMHEELTHFRKSTGKPVVAMMTDVAASGGYYIACACDSIWAQRSTVTGSIGVIMQMFDLTGTMQKIGLSTEAIKSGENKAAGSPFSRLTTEQRAIFQGIIDDMFNRFVEVVVKGRPALSESKVRELADGRVYTAVQALEHGLIDGLSTMRGAVASLKERTGQSSIRLVAYHRPLGYKPNYYAAAPDSFGDVNLLKLDPAAWSHAVTPQFMYLWAP